MNESQVKCKTCFLHRTNTIVVIIKLSYLSLGCNTKVVGDHNCLNNCGLRLHCHQAGIFDYGFFNNG